MEEMTLEEAMKRFGKNAKLLVATQDLENPKPSIPFVVMPRSDFDSLFLGVKTIGAIYDDFIDKYNLYTEKQDLMNIKPIGFLKTVLLKE